MAPKKVLVVLTSHDQAGRFRQPDWLPELAHPYNVLTAAGVELTVASPAGGLASLDPKSVEASAADASSQRFLAAHRDLWEQTARLGEFAGRAGEFDAVFFPGGHGPMFDLAGDGASRRLVAEFYDAGKVVAAVCHGPAALVDVVLADGTPLLRGKEVTGFSDSEEAAVELTKYMPFSLEGKLGEASGGRFTKAADWQEKVVVDGRVITGQNPASAKDVGEAILKAITS